MSLRLTLVAAALPICFAGHAAAAKQNAAEAKKALETAEAALRPPPPSKS
ncbi:hypothetical protein [Phenylobacterium sp. 58.2.17]|nr:hypothetical protein [Phenylobacterium sp. 58.2.17]MCX7585746.1 hypothetical protein [Phenylobacterium sp. 58.2.17]